MALAPRHPLDVPALCRHMAHHRNDLPALWLSGRGVSEPTQSSGLRVRVCRHCRGPHNGVRCPQLGKPGLPDAAERAVGVFPGACVQTWADVPATCPRPGCGGLWREISGGRACLLCGRNVYVAEALQTVVVWS